MTDRSVPKHLVLHRLRRVRCVLVGCAVAENYPACWHCEAPLYAYDGGPDYFYCEVGKLEWLFRSWSAVGRFFSKFTRKRCDQCGKKFWRGYDDQLCSEECHDEWLPF